MRLAPHAQPEPRSETRAEPRSVAIDTDRLDAMLGQLEDEHAQLLMLARAHRDAIGRASAGELKAITLQTSEVLLRIARIEDNRREMIADERGSIASLDELMDSFSADDRDRIGLRRQRLRELIARVKEEQDAVRSAGENLAQHMRGLIKQISASLSHAGTYSRVGAVDPSRTQVVSSLDLVR